MIIKRSLVKHISFLTSHFVNCDFLSIHLYTSSSNRNQKLKSIQERRVAFFTTSHTSGVLLTLIEKKTSCKSISYPAVKQNVFQSQTLDKLIVRGYIQAVFCCFLYHRLRYKGCLKTANYVFFTQTEKVNRKSISWDADLIT